MSRTEIPNSWDKVTLENYYPFERTLDEKPTTELEEFDLKVKRACFLSDMEVEDVLKLSIEELGNVDILKNSPYPNKIKKTFKFKGKRYRVLLDPRKWDAWRYQAIMNECRNEQADNVHKLMYLVTIEVKNRFSKKEIELEPDEIEARINEFKQLPVSLANPIGVFFWNLSNVLTDLILSYSETQMKNQKKKMEDQIDSLKNMDGL